MFEVPDAEGALALTSLGASVAIAPGPRLRLSWSGGATEVTGQI